MSQDIRDTSGAARDCLGKIPPLPPGGPLGRIEVRFYPTGNGDTHQILRAECSLRDPKDSDQPGLALWGRSVLVREFCQLRSVIPIGACTKPFAHNASNA